MEEMAMKIVIKGLGMLAKVALTEALRLYKGHRQVRPMQEQLRLFKAFLQYADSKPHKNDWVNGWVNEIRDVAYIIEDAIDVFHIDIEQNVVRDPSEISTSASNVKRVFTHPGDLIWFCNELEDIQKTVGVIHEKATQLALPNLSEETSSLDDDSYYRNLCLLYFAAFPKGATISAKQITRMWIAEGFIPKNANGTLEEKAESYLKELVQGGWIDVIENSGNGKRYCMPALSRDQAIQEAEAVNLFMVLSRGGGVIQRDGRVVRRAAMQKCTLTEYGSRPKNIHSLLFFGECKLSSHEFRLLRVLNIQGVDGESKINISGVEWLRGLIHLRYLGIRNCTGVASGFSDFSFSSFKKVETVDLKGTNFNQQPNDSIWGIPTLRHVIYPHLTLAVSKWDPPKNLQTLKVVDFENFLELKCNPNVGKIGLSMGKDFGRKYEKSIEKAQDKFKDRLKKMNLLVSLHIDGGENYILFPTNGFGCHKNIRSLRLRGEWPKNMVLDANTFPKNLTKLSLSGCLLERDPMSMLEGLQSLRILKLEGEVFKGKEMIARKGFPILEELYLCRMNLERLVIKETVKRNLSKLEIRACPKLDVIGS